MDGYQGDLPVEKWLQAFFPDVVLPDEIEQVAERVKYCPEKNSKKTSLTEAALCAQLVGGLRLALSAR